MAVLTRCLLNKNTFRCQRKDSKIFLMRPYQWCFVLYKQNNHNVWSNAVEICKYLMPREVIVLLIRDFLSILVGCRAMGRGRGGDFCKMFLKSKFETFFFWVLHWWSFLFLCFKSTYFRFQSNVFVFAKVQVAIRMHTVLLNLLSTYTIKVKFIHL